MGTHTGNPATVAPSTAAAAPPAQAKITCNDLEDKNKAERDKVIKELEDKSDRTQEEQETLDKARGAGMTISSASSSVPGARGVFSASSSGCAQACNPGGLVTGTPEQNAGMNERARARKSRGAARRQRAGVLCDQFVHPGGGKGAHAEPKIFNFMKRRFSSSPMRGGSVLLNIDWRFESASGATKRSGMPCPHCYAMLCHAATECKIKIFICDRTGKPQPLSKKNCEDDDGYEDLCRRVDRRPKPGR